MSFPTVPYEFAPVNPAPGGLLAAVNWQPDDGPPRWGPGGIELRPPTNYGGEDSTGVWPVDWLAAENEVGSNIKTGTPPDAPEEPFLPVVLYGFDWGLPSAAIKAEVEARARQNLRLQEPLLLADHFATRVLADAGTPTAADSIIEAVSAVEAAFALTNTVGVVHAAPKWAAYAAQANQLVRGSNGPRTPSGHLWVFDGGYTDELDDTLVGTSPVIGWRTEVATRDSLDFERNRYVVIAERSMVLAYESAIGAVEIS